MDMYMAISCALGWDMQAAMAGSVKAIRSECFLVFQGMYLHIRVFKRSG